MRLWGVMASRSPLIAPGCLQYKDWTIPPGVSTVAPYTQLLLAFKKRTVWGACVVLHVVCSRLRKTRRKAMFSPLGLAERYRPWEGPIR